MNAKDGEPMSDLNRIKTSVETLLRELVEAGNVQAGQIVIIGTSTSEVLGKHIGTAGAEEVAEQLFSGIDNIRKAVGFHPVFQCCEHLNRALVVERALLKQLDLEEVSVIPVPKAGGSMGAYAYRHLDQACVVETIQAHAGIDIGNTLIGMHLRRVAVPFRPSIKTIGAAHVTAAYTRPKLIGGIRAVYELDAQKAPENQTSC
jgi:uncharacterized protein (TIGR01440 family)